MFYNNLEVYSVWSINASLLNLFLKNKKMYRPLSYFQTVVQIKQKQISEILSLLKEYL